MTLTITRGDIFQSQAQAIAFGIDAAGRLGVSPAFTTLQDRYPVFVSECRKREREAALAPGSVWVWREAVPWIVALVVRETPYGATRLRYVEATMLYLRQNWEREGLSSVALLRLGDDTEWLAAQRIVAEYLDSISLPVTVYDAD